MRRQIVLLLLLGLPLTGCSVTTGYPTDRVVVDWEPGSCPKGKSEYGSDCNDGLDQTQLFSISELTYRKSHKFFSSNSSTPLSEYPPPTNMQISEITKSVPHFAPMSILPQYMMRRDTGDKNSDWYYELIIEWNKRFGKSKLFSYLSSHRGGMSSQKDISYQWGGHSDWGVFALCHEKDGNIQYLYSIIFSRPSMKTSTDHDLQLYKDEALCKGDFIIP